MTRYFYRYWLPTGKWSPWESCSSDDYENAKSFEGWEVKIETATRTPKEQTK